MRVEEVVVGRRQPEVLHAPGEDPRQHPREPPLQADRQPRVDLDDLIGGFAEDVLRHDPRAGAGREEDGVRDGLAPELGDDVDGGVADPDDEHALAIEVEWGARVDVVVRVDRGPVERAGEVGVAGVPVVPVADEQRVEALGRAVCERDLPAAAGPALGAGNARVEADPLAQGERVGVVAQPLEDVRVVGVVGVARGHREVREGDRGLGDVDVQRAVCRGGPVRVFEVPVAADLVGDLEARVGDAAIGERLARGQPADAGSDHADRRKLTHLTKSYARERARARNDFYGATYRWPLCNALFGNERG